MSKKKGGVKRRNAAHTLNQKAGAIESGKDKLRRRRRGNDKAKLKRYSSVAYEMGLY